MSSMTNREKKLMRRLQHPGRAGRNNVQFLSYFLFLFGGAALVVTMLYLRLHMNGKSLYTIGLPGLLSGLIICLLGYYLMHLTGRPGRKRSPRRH